jgi:TRIAD3 protein (E3 ubiquitin-protein ligase RNF216)
VFPHIPAATIAEVVEDLRPNFLDQPERLLDRATSELLRGNFMNKKVKLVDVEEGEEMEVAMVRTGPNGPSRDLVMEKVEITQFILDMYPNVDPEWLSKHYETVKYNSEHALRSKSHIQGLLANYMIEHTDYPKKASAANKANSNAPVDYSKYDQAITSADYRTNCLDQIQQDFRWLTLPELRSVLQRFGYHYYPAYNFLKKDMEGSTAGVPKSASKLKMLTKERVSRIVDLYNPEFVVEYEFTHREEVKLREEEQKKLQQQWEDEENERAGAVMECGCCFIDVPISRMVQCAEGHLFCSDCIKKYVEETVYASGQTTVHCLDQDGCKANFPMTQLERAVPAHQLSKIFARLADLDIQKAGLENVHRCPHCDFQMEIPNPDERLFNCRNPECGLETCLLCKEPNHIPLRCEEVEKKNVTDYRKKVEEAMTASLVRTCPKCKAKFFKTEGCNKMTCSCGAASCYVCREQISHKEGYNHFCQHDRNPREFGKCSDCKKCFLFLRSTEEADQQLVAAAKAEATKEFAADDANLAQVQVGTAIPAPKATKKSKKKGAMPAMPAMPAMGVAGGFGFGQVNQMVQNAFNYAQLQFQHIRHAAGLPAPPVGLAVDWRGQVQAPPAAPPAARPPPPAALPKANPPKGQKKATPKAPPVPPRPIAKAAAAQEPILILDDDVELPPREGVKRRAYEVMPGRNNARIGKLANPIALREEDWDEDEEDDDFEAEEDYEDEDDFDDVEERM